MDAQPRPPPLEPPADHGDYVKAVERVREAAADYHQRLAAAGCSPFWVLYEPTTRDMPGAFVARLWMCTDIPGASPPQRSAGPTTTVIRAGTLEQLRDLLPHGLACFGRADGDDPAIIETWL